MMGDCVQSRTTHIFVEMPLSCTFLEKLSLCCPCKLNIIGCVSGWLGVIWRLTLLVFFSTTLSNVTPYDPSIYSIGLATCMAYVLTSFVINLLFIYGVYKEKRHFLLPYLTIVALEMIVGVMILSGIIMILFAIGSISMAIYFIIVAVLTIGAHFTLWLYNILLFKELVHKSLVRNGKTHPVELIRVVTIKDSV